MFYGSDEFNSAIENTHGNAPKTRLKFADDEILDLVSSIRYYGGSNDSDDVSIGTTTMARVEVSAYTDKLLTNREFLLEQGIELANGVVEYMPIGYFTIQKPSGDIDQVTFTAYDRMQKFEKPYSSNLAYPTTSALILNELCQICGIELATTLDNAIEVTENLKGYTCREVLGYIASMHGYFACIDRYGRLNLRWYSNTPIEKSLKKIWHFEKSQDNFEIARVEIAKDSETKYESGNGITTLHNSNPLATQEIVDNIFAKLGGFNYSVGEIEMLDDARLDPWDMISVEYYDGKTYKIPCMSLEHDFKAYSTTVKSVGKSESENEYRFTGPTIQYLNRMAADLLVANRVIATKVDAEYVNSVAITTENFDAKVAEIKELIVEEIDGKYANIDLANIDIANINVGKIGELFAKVGLIDRATIVEGHITGFLDAVEVNANKITAGTLVADRILLSGGDKGVLYALNNLGELTSTNVDSLDGYVLTDRTINADKLIANSITANELDVNQIFGNEAVLNKLVSQEIFSDAVATNTVVVGASKDAKDALDLANFINTASGSPILLTDSADGFLIDFKAYGRSTQDGIPTPNSPQTINSVADSGYFDGELLHGYYDEAGVLGYNSSYVCSKNLIPCNSGDTVKLVYATDMGWVAFAFYDKNKNIVSRSSTDNVTEYEAIAPTNTKYVHFMFREVSGTITPQTAKPITVTINGKYALIVKSVNKNLLDYSRIKTTSANGATLTNNNDGSFTISGSGILSNAFNTYFDYSHEETVRLLKVGELKLDINGVATTPYLYIQLRSGTNAYLQISSSDDVKTKNVTQAMLDDENVYLRIGFYGASTGVSIVGGTMKPMLYQYGDSDFVAHKNHTSYIPLSAPLRSNLDGSVTDEVSLTEVTRRFAEVVFDGTEDWHFADNSNINYTYTSSISNAKPNSLVVCNAMCSTDLRLEENNCYINANKIPIFCSDSITSVAEFKAWLQANPITVQYELAEPITESIEPVDITTYDNITYITASDNADMWVQYYRNTPTGIQLAKLSTIERDNNRILANWASDNDVTLIDGAKIYTGSITADKIDVNDLFAQNITADGSITGVTLISGTSDDRYRVLVQGGAVDFQVFDTRGDGDWKVAGSLYASSSGSVDGEGYWTFEGLSTSAGNDVDDMAQDIATINSKLISYVTPQMYGAIGDGITDDTKAFQKALNTGLSLYVPLLNGSRYKITDTLYLTSQRQSITGDIGAHDWAYFTDDTEYKRGCIAFQTSVTDKPLFYAKSSMNCFVNLSCRAVNNITGYAIRYEKDEDKTNADGTIKNCSFRDFDTAVYNVGRGLSCLNNLFVSCSNDIVVYLPKDLAWTTSTGEDVQHQTHPDLLGRALRVINNRHHITKSRLLKVVSEDYTYDGVNYITALKGAIITGNVCDLGRGSYEFDCRVEDSVITNNVVNRCQMTNIFSFNHNVRNTNICGNNVKGDIHDMVTPYTPTNFIRGDKFYDCTIANNNISNIKGSCIFTLNNGLFERNSIIGNVMTNTGYDDGIIEYQRSAFILANATKNIITNNVFGVMINREGCCVRPINNDGVWNDNIIINNILPYGIEAIIEPANNSNRNKIENNM